MLRDVIFFGFAFTLIVLSFTNGITPLRTLGLLLISYNVVTFMLNHHITTIINNYTIIFLLLYSILLLFGLDLAFEFGYLHMNNNSSGSNYSGYYGNENSGSSNTPNNGGNNGVLPHQG